MSKQGTDSRNTAAGSQSTSSRPLKLRIMDNQVQIACRPGDEDALLEAAAYIDHSMRELRKRNTNSSIEKIAIVTAINTANSLLKARSEQSHDQGSNDDNGHNAQGNAEADGTTDNSLTERIATMNLKLDELLEPVSTDTYERENSHE